MFLIVVVLGRGRGLPSNSAHLRRKFEDRGVNLKTLDSTAFNDFSPGMLEANLMSGPTFTLIKTLTDVGIKEIDLPTYIKNNQIGNILENINNAQLMENPSDVVLFMTRNFYIRIGKEFRKLNEPYKMRLSKFRINHGKKETTKFWNLPPNSILNEPLNIALLKIKVRNMIIYECRPLNVASLGNAKRVT